MEKEDLSHIDQQQNPPKAEMPPAPIGYIIGDGLADSFAKNIFARQKAELGEEIGSEKLRLSEEDLSSILRLGFRALLESVARMLIPLAMPQKPPQE